MVAPGRALTSVGPLTDSATMDIVTGNTEAMLRFYRFHERLNRSVKVQAFDHNLNRAAHPLAGARRLET